MSSPFSPCSPSRVGSTPLPLFPRVILAPVFGCAYSGPTTPLNHFHKARNYSTSQDQQSASLLFGLRSRLHCRLRPPRHDEPCGAAAIVNLRFLGKYPAFIIFSANGAVKFPKIFEEDRDIPDPSSSLRCRANQKLNTLTTGGASPTACC